MASGAPSPEEPSNRWPWVALAAGLVVVAIAVAVFFVNRSNTVNVNIEGTPTPNPLAAPVSPGPPPTLVPPTLPPSASLVVPVSPAAPSPSPTTVPSPTAPASPTPPPASPTPPPASPTPPPPAQAPTAAPAATPATAPPSPAPGAPASPVATAPAAAAATGTPFSGQVSPAGGLGNTRADLDAAYGAPVGETPEHLVVYRKNSFEYHAGFVPDPNGRAALIVQMPQQTASLDLSQAQTEAHRLLPLDAQPPNPTPEGNAQFVVERFASQTLAHALPPEAFSGGQPGQFLIVYARDAQGKITRWVLGAGNDPNALLNQGR